jgi:hypothetical protein
MASLLEGDDTIRARGNGNSKGKPVTTEPLDTGPGVKNFGGSVHEPRAPEVLGAGGSERDSLRTSETPSSSSGPSGPGPDADALTR